MQMQCYHESLRAACIFSVTPVLKVGDDVIVSPKPTTQKGRLPVPGELPCRDHGRWSKIQVQRYVAWDMTPVQGANRGLMGWGWCPSCKRDVKLPTRERQSFWLVRRGTLWPEHPEHPAEVDAKMCKTGGHCWNPKRARSRRLQPWQAYIIRNLSVNGKAHKLHELRCARLNKWNRVGKHLMQVGKINVSNSRRFEIVDVLMLDGSGKYRIAVKYAHLDVPVRSDSHFYPMPPSNACERLASHRPELPACLNSVCRVGQPEPAWFTALSGP